MKQNLPSACQLSRRPRALQVRTKTGGRQAGEAASLVGKRWYGTWRVILVLRFAPGFGASAICATNFVYRNDGLQTAINNSATNDTIAIFPERFDGTSLVFDRPLSVLAANTNGAVDIISPVQVTGTGDWHFQKLNFKKTGIVQVEGTLRLCFQNAFASLLGKTGGGLRCSSVTYFNILDCVAPRPCLFWLAHTDKAILKTRPSNLVEVVACAFFRVILSSKMTDGRQVVWSISYRGDNEASAMSLGEFGGCNDANRDFLNIGFRIAPSHFAIKTNSLLVAAGPPEAVYNNRGTTNRNDIGFTGGPFFDPAYYTNGEPLMFLLTDVPQLIPKGRTNILSVSAAAVAED